MASASAVRAVGCPKELIDSFDQGSRKSYSHFETGTSMDAAEDSVASSG